MGGKKERQDGGRKEGRGIVQGSCYIPTVRKSKMTIGGVHVDQPKPDISHMEPSSWIIPVSISFFTAASVLGTIIIEPLGSPIEEWGASTGIL